MYRIMFELVPDEMTYIKDLETVETVRDLPLCFSDDLSIKNTCIGLCSASSYDGSSHHPT
jgi:hypothetical protein